MSPDTRHDAVMLHPDDNVATVLRDVARGEVLRVQLGAEITDVPCVEDIRLCHKVAVHTIPAGVAVRKYGEEIGEATLHIARGAHVHVHNLRSRRGGSAGADGGE